jgi:hypothetical protein
MSDINDEEEVGEICDNCELDFDECICGGEKKPLMKRM